MAEIKKISTELQLLDKFLDTSGDAGTSGQVLTSTGTGINWVSGGSLPGGPYLPLSAGSSYPLTGDLYIAKAANQGQLFFGTANANYEIFGGGFWGYMGYNTNGYHRFLIQGAEIMRIHSNSNVGIGTTLPNAKFEVTGNLEDNWAGRFENTNSGGYGILAKIAGTSANERIFEARVGSSTKMIITGEGNVGIGTTSPVDRLTIYDSDDNVGVYFQTATSGTSTGDGFRVGLNNSHAFLWNYENTPLAFATNGSQKATILANGNFGIGTSSPSVQLEVANKSLTRHTSSSWGQSAIANPNDSEVAFVWAAGGTGYPGITSTYTRQWIAGLSPFNTGTDRWSLTNKTLGANTAITVLEDGKIGMGTTSPVAKLDVFSAASFRADVATGNPLISIVNNTATSNVAGTATIKFTQANTQAGGKIVSGRDGNYSSGATRTSNLQFYTSTNATDTERMRINSAGTVLINASAPRESASKLSVQGGMSEFETTLTNGSDWANSPVSILERANIGTGSSDNKYSPNLNFHWSGRVSNSLWMSDNGHLNWGSYTSGGVPAADGVFRTQEIYLIGTGRITGVDTVSASTDAANKAYVDAHGGGIGPFLPLAGGTLTGDLNIHEASSPTLSIKDTTQNTTLLVFSQDSNSHVGTYSSHPLVFDTNSLERMRITSSGNVGIGTTTVQNKLVVRGSGSAFNSTMQNSTASIISKELTDNAYHSILQLVAVRQSLTTGKDSQGYLGFSTIDDSNNQGQLDAGRIAIVNETGSSRNSATALTFWTNPGGTQTTAAVEKMRISSAGTIKFNAYNGTNNTGSPTHILGTDANGLIVKSTAGSSIGPWLPLAAGSGERVTGDLYISEAIFMRPSATYGGGYRVMTATGTNSAPYTSTLSFSNYAQSNVMVIQGSNVGIGTTSPTGYRLVVENTSEDLLKLHNSTDGLDALISFTNPGGTLGRIQGIDNGGLGFDVGNNAGGIVSNAMFIKNNGNVGIGTASPAAKLDVRGSGGYLRFDTSNSNGSIKSDFNLQLYADPEDDNSSGYQNIQFFTAGTSEKMRIDYSGRVGIGNTNPSRPLDVTADTGGVALKLRARSGNDYSFMSFTQNDGSGTAWAELAGIGTGGGLRIDTAGAERMRIASNGGVGINTTNPTEKLEVNGNVKVQGNIIVNSDIELGPSSRIQLDDTPTASTASGSGTIVNWSVSESTTAGTLYTVKSNGGWTTTDADTEAKSIGMLAIALSSNANLGMLLQGFFYKASHGFTIGLPLYISNTAGAFSTTRPTGTNDYVRIIGYATSANYIYFDPDKTWVKLSS